MSGASTCVLMSPTPVLLRSLKRLLEPELEVVAMSDNTVSCVEAIKDLEPDVVLVDVDPDQRPFLRRLLARRPELRIVALSEHAESARVQELLDLGVLGYVNKLGVTDDLTAALRAASRGESFFSSP